MIDILDYITLSNCAKAIRICHDTIDKCDSDELHIGENDRALIKRVGVKMKHASTLEHLRFTFGIKRIFDMNVNNIEDKKKLDNVINIQSFFKDNKFSLYSNMEDVEPKPLYSFVITTNMRVLVENKEYFTKEMLDMFIPNDYRYLLEDKEK